MDLLLIRHALPIRVEGADGPADPHLSELGWAQSRALADWLEPEPVDVLCTSPMVRARETAIPLAEARHLEPIVVDGVAEFDRHAEEYVPLEELKAENDPRWQQLVEGGYFDEGELTAEDFVTTVVGSIDQIIADNPGRTVAVVCHGGVINAYLAHVLGIDDFLFFEPTYTGISRLKASSRGHRTIVSVNETAHLRQVPDEVETDT